MKPRLLNRELMPRLPGSCISLLLTSQIAKTVELLLPGTKQLYGKVLSQSRFTSTYGIEVAGGPFSTFVKAGLESVLCSTRTAQLKVIGYRTPTTTPTVRRERTIGILKDPLC